MMSEEQLKEALLKYTEHRLNKAKWRLTVRACVLYPLLTYLWIECTKLAIWAGQYTWP